MFHHPFESWVSVSVEELEDLLANPAPLPWLEFWLNPRRLRGSDFLMRWSQGVWSEKRLLEAVNTTKEFFAIPYGPSGTAPTKSVREFELYFERLEAAGRGKIKRPDLLIFRTADKAAVEKDIAKAGGLTELPFLAEEAKLLPACVEDKNGHILPYVTFDGGRLQLSEQSLQILGAIPNRKSK
jgi:AccI restriction endonuclease